MLLRDAMEPLARLVPHVLRYYGCDLGKAWKASAMTCRMEI